MEWSGYVYACSAGETFDSAARAIWGSEKYAAELMCLNPELVGKPAFDGSERLYLPRIDAPVETNAAAVPDRSPWRE